MAKYWIWLQECLGPVSVTAHLLLEHFGTAEAVYRADERALKDSGILQPEQLRTLRLASLRRADQILQQCQDQDIQTLCWDDPRYPDSLRQVYAPPLVLYCLGKIPDFCARVTVCMVGTRYPSATGLATTRRLSAELTQAGAIVVSGMAIGIDAAAHAGAVLHQGASIGVVCCGVDVDYPKENIDLKWHILQQGGMICSELAPGTPMTEQSKAYIPQRNRLLSGLSACTIVTEAPLHSGVVHTVNHTIEQGKEVFCLPPADIYDDHFAGNLQFLQDGAIPVYRVREILFPYLATHANTLNREMIEGKIPMTVDMDRQIPFAAVPIATPTTKPQDQTDFDSLSDVQQAIVRALYQTTMQVDDLGVTVGLLVYQLFCELTELELTGWIEPIQGNRYRRIRAVRIVL